MSEEPTTRRSLVLSEQLHVEAVKSIDDSSDDDKEEEEGFTLFQGIIAILKGAVGPAVLFMPRGFWEAGLIFGLAMLFLSYALFGYGSQRLLETWFRRKKSYSSMMGEAYGPYGVLLVRITIIAQQCGLCVTYYNFVATNVRDILMYLGVMKSPSLILLSLLQIPVYAPLACVRDLKYFIPTNLAATVLTMYSLVVLCVFGIVKVITALGGSGDDSPSEQNHTASSFFSTTIAKNLFNPSQFYLFIGTSAFIYEGAAALFVPVQAVIRTDLQPQFPRLFLKTVAGIVGSYICFGLLNWAAYGDHVETVLTVNLPEGPWKTSVQLAYTTAVILTFPLQLFPALQIMIKWTRCDVEPPPFVKDADTLTQALISHTTTGGTPTPPSDGGVIISSRPPGSRVSDASSSLSSSAILRFATWPARLPGDVARCGLVLLLSAISIQTVNDLDKLVALLGGLLGIPLAMIYPVAIHYKLIKDAPPRFRFLDRLCLVVGIALALISTAITIATW